MDPSLQRRVQRYGWDRASAHYEHFWERQLKPAQDFLLEMANPKPGERVLDIACGTGLVSFQICDRIGENGFVLACDISDKMLEQASARINPKQINRISFERMDAEALQITEGSFDLAVCALGLMYMPSPLKALQEIYRGLKPGGRVVAAVWGQRDHCGWAEIFEIVDRYVASEVCPMFFNLGNPDMLEMTLKAAGFHDMISRRISCSLEYQDGQEACGAAFAGGPVALAYHKFTDQVKKQAETAYLESIRQYKKDERYIIPGEFIVAAGYK
jgi:ubiquinone/menaquinone biosynthesis C-methylase UbiE